MFEDFHVARLTMNQPVAEPTVYVFVCEVLGYAINGAFYTNMTGAFLVTSLVVSRYCR